jgi:hypothetical protein
MQRKRTLPDRNRLSYHFEVPYDGGERELIADLIINPALFRLEVTDWWLLVLSDCLPFRRVKKLLSGVSVPFEDGETFNEFRVRRNMKWLEVLLSEPEVREKHPSYSIESVSKIIDSTVEFFTQKMPEAFFTLWSEMRALAHNSTLPGISWAAWTGEYAAVKKKELRRLLGVREDARGGSEPEVKATDEQCRSLVETYPAMLKRWQGWKALCGTKNWRGHIKLDHPDTPDDLLDRLEDLDPYTSKPSAVALEHAARICGIRTNGCGYSTLKRLRSRGIRLLGAAQT